MFFQANTLASNSRMRGHWDALWANRNVAAIQHNAMVEQFRPSMSPEMLAANAVGVLTRDFWAEIDRQIIQMRDLEVGMEILNDLLGIQTIIPIGKTAKLYNMIGDIAEDVAVSIDGQAPYSYDFTDYSNDGDPVPIFTAGYGVNWRHGAGLATVGIDLVLDSQAAKMRMYNRQLVKYLLDGSDRIQVDAYPGQGLRNHRNTIKLDLGASGANLDLTSANLTALLAFFGSGAFGDVARLNKVPSYDVLWVSYEIWANLSQPNLIVVGAGSDTVINGTRLSAVLPFAPVKEIRPTYALSGNEFIAYQRTREVLSPLIGMTTGTTPLPRPLPQTNYNFQIMGAMGLQVKKDSEGKSGVLYGSEIT